MSETGESILRGAREGFAAHVPAQVDVRAIRRNTGLSQAMFAGRFGFTVAAPLLGEHHRAVPTEHGYSEPEIDNLIAEGAVVARE